MNQYHTSSIFGLALVVGLGIAAAPAAAGSLQVSEAARDTPSGDFVFTIRNQGAGALHELRLRADRDHLLGCGETASGESGAADLGLLAAGASLECRLRPAGASSARDASVVLSARGADGLPRVQALRFAFAPVATPDQGIVVLLAGGVHDDANADGLLDAGETIDYFYRVLNLGTGTLSNLALVDIDGAVGCPYTTLATGTWMSCTSQHLISASEASDGFVMNEAEVSGLDDLAEPVEANDMVLRVNLGGDADVRAFKSPLLADDVDASGYASVGDLVRYTFVLGNSGGDPLSAVDLLEPDPSRIDTPISCAATTLDGQPFAGLGSGSLQPGDALLCSADYTIRTSDASVGSADNLAEISAQPSFGGPIYGAAASAVVVPAAAEIELSKTLLAESGVQSGIAEPGETLSYIIRVRNIGGVDAFNVAVVDPLDPNVSFVSADHGGSFGSGSVSWAGLTIPAGGYLDLNVVVRVDDPLAAGVDRIVNLAVLEGGTPPDCSSAPLPPECVVLPTAGEVAIAKVLLSESGSQPGVAEPGETLVYGIHLNNAGGSPVSGYGVSDPLDPNVNFVGADHGGVYAAGTVTWTGLTIPTGGSLSLQVTVTVDDPLAAGVTQIVNLAHETGTPPVDCNLLPTPDACVLLPVEESPRLQVTKTVAESSVAPGGTVSFSITVRNVGTVDVANMTVSDPLPAGIVDFAWSCIAAGGASCANASGSGAIFETIPLFPVGGSLVYSIVATVADNASGSLLNRVQVEPSSLALCMPGATPGPCDASATVPVIPAAGPVVPVPVDGRLALLLLGLGLVLLAGRRAARS